MPTTTRSAPERRGRGRRLAAIAAGLGVVLAAVSAVVLPRGVTAHAEDRPLASTPIITWNMQGQTSSGLSIWNRVSNYLGGVQIVLLQEAGSGPPPSSHPQDDIVHGGTIIRHSTWLPSSTRGNGPYELYWLQTDTNRNGLGGRVNMAIATVGVPDEVNVVDNPVNRGRQALGVRFGNNWYFTFHALSGGGPDSAQMLAAINNTVRGWNANYRWTVGGDFNQPPADLRNVGNLPGNANFYTTGMPTRQASNRELDYFVSSHQLNNLSRFRLPMGGSSDHNPVQLGGMRAGAEPVAPQRHSPIGDSNVQGHRSSDGLGFRGILYTLLAAGMYTLGSVLVKRGVDYVGSQGSDNLEHEGVPGDTIEMIAARARTSVPQYRPNVVTLLAGTNDVDRGLSAGAPQRAAALIDQILRDSPGVTIVASELLGTKDNPELQSRMDQFNNEFRELVRQRQADGKKVLVVNMDFLTPNDMSDTLHPNDAGYEKMAYALAGGVMEAGHQGWISESAEPPGSGDCSDAQNRWEVRKGFASGVGASASDVAFADMDGDGSDDYLKIGPGGSIDVWYNRGGDRNGQPGWQPGGRIAAGVDVDLNEQHLEFADVAGDPRDDYLVVDRDTGKVDAYINEGGDSPNGSPGWSVRKNFAQGTPEATRGWVTFGDVGGDSKDDYVVVDATITTQMAALYAWENKGGDRDGVAGWQPMGKIASGVTRDFTAKFSVNRHDCDDKDDYWVLYDNGAVDVWLNKGGDKPDGTAGWLPRGRTAAGTGTAGDVRFADVDGDGRDDYLVVAANGAVDAYLNRGGDPT